MTVNCFSLIFFKKNILTSYITKNSIGSTKVGFNGIKILLNSIYLEFPVNLLNQLSVITKIH